MSFLRNFILPLVTEFTVAAVDLNSPLLKKIPRKLTFDMTVHMTSLSAKVRISESKTTKRLMPMHIAQEIADTVPYAEIFRNSSLRPVRKTVVNRL